MGKPRTLAVDICRVHTDRLRAMREPELRRALKRYQEAPSNRHALEYSRAVVTGFIRTLLNERDWANINREVANKDTSAAMWRKAQRETRRTEELVWDTQAQANCNIRGPEMVARDADREGAHDRAALIRKQRSLAARRKR